MWNSSGWPPFSLPALGSRPLPLGYHLNFCSLSARRQLHSHNNVYSSAMRANIRAFRLSHRLEWRLGSAVLRSPGMRRLQRMSVDSFGERLGNRETKTSKSRPVSAFLRVISISDCSIGGRERIQGCMRAASQSERKRAREQNCALFSSCILTIDRCCCQLLSHSGLPFSLSPLNLLFSFFSLFLITNRIFVTTLCSMIFNNCASFPLPLSLVSCYSVIQLLFM